MNLVFNGTITAVEPISIVLPDTGLATMPVVTPTGEQQTTAYVTAGTIRGTLRRAVTFALMRSAAERGQPWHLHTVYNNVLGQNRDSEESVEAIDLPAIRAARSANPIIDLFGSGLGFKSSLEVAHAIPTTPVAVVTLRGSRRDLDADMDAIEMMSDEDQALWRQRTGANYHRAKAQALLEALQRSLRTLKGEERTAVEKKVAALQAEVAAQEARMLGMAVSTRQPIDYKAMPAGVLMQHSIRLVGVNPNTEAVLLAALNYFSASPKIGGQRARGAGQVKASYKVSRVDGFQSEVLGALELGDFQKARLNPASVAAQQWYDATLARWEPMLNGEAGFNWNAAA